MITVNNKLPFNERILFIEQNFIDWMTTLLYPILSATFFVVIYPFVTTGAMYVWLRHKKWQNELKNKIENLQLIPLDKSIALRLEMKNQSTLFQALLEGKDSEIEGYKKKVDELKQKLDSQTVDTEVGIERKVGTESAIHKVGEVMSNIYTLTKEQNEFEQILDNPLSSNLKGLIEIVTKNLTQGVMPTKVISFFESSDIIQKNPNNSKLYLWTEKGKRFLNYYYKKEYKEQ
ncbi:MAG: hypothetical protein WCZ90_12985 [Melioribacteraceae bacterium]